MNESAKLTEEKICECLKSLNVPVRINDLKMPTKEFIIRIFDTFLKDLQISINNLMLRPFEALRQIENPEMYEEGQMLIVLVSVMNEILGHISPLVVTINDVVAPKPKRTKKILNYLIIFWNTYYKKYSLFLSVEENLKEKIQKAEDLKQENETLDEKYLECVEKLRNINPTKDELVDIVSSKSEKLKKLEKHREMIMEEHQCLKEKENNLRTQISNLDVEIVTKKERLNELDQVIISSPEKISADVQKIKEQVKEINQKIQEKEVEKKEKKKSYRSLVSAQEYVNNMISKQHEIHNELQSLSETVQNLSLLTAKCQEEKESLKELLSTQERKEVLADVYHQRAAKIQLTKKKQFEEMTEVYKNLQRQESDAKIAYENLNLSIVQLEEEISKIADSIIETVQKCKEAKAVTDKIKEQHAVEVKQIAENFQTDCKEITMKAKHLNGFQ